MNDWRAKLLFCLVLWVAAWPGFSCAHETKARFAALDIYLETDEPVAAWAFELSEAGGRMDVVGVENGDSPAFAKAPYYGRTAVADRVMVRDFTRNWDEITVGRVRIATVHVRLAGDSEPDYALRLVAAAGPRLVRAPASLHLEVRSVPDASTVAARRICPVAEFMAMMGRPVEEVGVVPMPFRIYGVAGNRITYVVVGDDGQVWMRGALTKDIRNERLNIEVGIDGRVVQVNCG